MKKVMIKTIKITFLLILFLILGEVASRIFLGNFERWSAESGIGDTRMLYEPSKTRYWKFSPNAEVKWDITENTREYILLKINSKGLRDYEYSYERPEGVYRIVLLGDSMSVGFEVELEDTFPKVMEKLGDSKLEVINLAVKAYDPTQEFVALEEDGFLYNPNLVMLAFTDSDFEGTETSDIFTIKDGKLIRNYNVYNPKFMELRNFLYKWSSLYNILGGLVRLSFLKEQKKGFNIDKQTESYKGEITKTRLLLKHLQNILQEKGIDFVVVIIPAKQQIYEEWFKKMVDQYGGGKPYEEFGTDSVTEKLKLFLKESNIQFIDLYPVLKNESDYDDSLYLGFDADSRHFSKKTHRLIGETIYSKWEEMYGNNTK